MILHNKIVKQNVSGDFALRFLSNYLDVSCGFALLRRNGYFSEADICHEHDTV